MNEAERNKLIADALSTEAGRKHLAAAMVQPIRGFPTPLPCPRCTESGQFVLPEGQYLPRCPVCGWQAELLEAPLVSNAIRLWNRAARCYGMLVILEEKPLA